MEIFILKQYNSVIRCVFIIFFLLHFSVHAVQKTSLPLEDYYTQTWGTLDGLPHNGITQLTQTQDGYLWIATWEGLARFNGKEFKVFTRGSKLGLPDSAVKSLTALPDGGLLVAGARGGISERKNRRWKSQKPTTTMVNHAIYDNDGNIWLALDGEGLIFRDKENQQDTTIISDIRVFYIAQDKNNTIWAATNRGLYAVKNKILVNNFSQHHGLPNIPVYSVYVTQENQLLVGTEKGVFKYKDNQFILIHERLKSEAVISILQDTNDNLWFGTSNHGVFKLSKNKLENLNDNTGLPDNRINSIYEDKENSIWLGTGSGLFRLRKAPFITLTSRQGLSGNYVRSVLSHSNGSIWVGSSKGLNKIQNNTISTVIPSNNKLPVSVLSLAEGENNQVLVGTYTQGVFKVVNNELVPFINKSNGLKGNEVRAILYDSKHNIWIGTTSGLVKREPNGKLTHFNKLNGLPGNFIMALTEDENGKIWVGTGVGIATYYNNAIEIYRLKEQFDAEYAFGFHTKDNAIWMATDRGIIRINLTTNEMVAIARSNGLPIDKIFQVVSDNEDNFWLTSNRGIIKISNEEINNVLNNKNQIVKYEIFTRGVGLLSIQANGASNPAATLHKDGSIWIATSKGVSQVSNDRLKETADKKLPVIIENFVADGKNYQLAINREKEALISILLPAGTSRIIIHYAALGFLIPRHIQYQTQLLGFDKNWLNKNNQTYSEFTNLPPGNYTFNMRAKYPNGKWHNDIATITFTIPSQFWQTLWFKFLIITIVLFSFYFIYRYRIRSIQYNEARLKQLIAKQTKDLKQQADSFAYQATHDQLTDLPNRRAFDAWCDSDFQQTKKNGDNLSLAIIDIDHFKKVNDKYSHLVGDKVIKVVANILLELSSQYPQKIKPARWGGEEFTLLILDSKNEAFDCCEQIRKTIENCDLSSIAKGLSITISIGITDNSSVNEYNKMINNADLALYYAKHHGRNQVKLYEKDDVFYHQDRRKK